MDKTVTIITPTYHREEKILQRCLGSVRVQSYLDWTQIVCSDGEPEEIPSRLVASSPVYCRVKYQITHKAYRNYGYRVRNEVLQDVNTEYVCFLDDDNLILPTYLLKMVQAIESMPKAEWAVCSCLHYGPLREDLHGKPPIVLSGIPPKLFYIDISQVVVRTKIFKELGGFTVGSTDRDYCGDGRTFEKLAEKYSYAVVPEVLTIHF